jgi:hypothetical protein
METRCEVVADLARRLARRSRFKVRGEAQPEPWAKWIIARVPGYLEFPESGPYPLREIEWAELEPGPQGIDALAAELAAAGLLAAASADTRPGVSCRGRNSTQKTFDITSLLR